MQQQHSNDSLLSRRAFIAAAGLRAAAPAPVRQPNIGWIWGDNLAYQDVGVCGNPVYDGQNIWPLLAGSGDIKREHPFFWVFLDNVTTIRDGRWKLHVAQQEKPMPKPELYDVESDPAEASSLTDKHPEIVARLKARIDAFQETIPMAWRLDYTVRDPRKLKSGRRTK